MPLEILGGAEKVSSDACFRGLTFSCVSCFPKFCVGCRYSVPPRGQFGGGVDANEEEEGLFAIGSSSFALLVKGQISQEF